jgi:hypothetical protein
MKKIFIALGVIFFLIVVGAVVLFLTLPKSTSTSPSGTTTTFPSSSVTTVPASSGSNSLMTITQSDGTKIDTQNFIDNGTTIQDPANKGTYYLAGSSGACNKDGTCPSAGNPSDFTILYYPDQQSFNIGLTSEPLGQARKDAEQYLSKTLGITQQQMCNLNYSIGTTVYVNAQYAGENLGFSFCPGAVALP